MTRQVITIHANGDVSGLQRKAGQGINLARDLGGTAEVERVSEIKWDKTQQAWFIEVLRGPLAGVVTTHALSRYAIDPERFALNGALLQAGEIIFYADYDDAVALEVAYLDTARAGGTY